jgi:hypothetical protein
MMQDIFVETCELDKRKKAADENKQEQLVPPLL